MGKEWDKGGQDFHRGWAEQAYRVLKPGGHMLVAGIGRTHHRMMCGVEDAGFEVRDCIYHFFGSGFPKSLDMSKAIDKAVGVEQKILGHRQAPRRQGTQDLERWRYRDGEINDTAPATDAAKQWQGWGTALKPAAEVWVLFRKPLSEKNVAANVLKHGTGAINVDGTRVNWQSKQDYDFQARPASEGRFYKTGPLGQLNPTKWEEKPSNPAGRWPPNVMFTHHPDCQMVGQKRVVGAPHLGQKNPELTMQYSGGTMGGGLVKPSSGYADSDGLETVPDWRCVEGCPVKELGRQSGERPGPWSPKGTKNDSDGGYGGWAKALPENERWFGGTGTAARFFPQFAWEEADFWPFKYVAKADRAERERGVEGDKLLDGHIVRARNNHPTVKPLALMRWLITLVTPPGGLILDPFAGSGSTLVAAKELGFRSIGIEQLNDKEHPYCEIAKGRIIAAQPGLETGVLL